MRHQLAERQRLKGGNSRCAEGIYVDNIGEVVSSQTTALCPSPHTRARLKFQIPFGYSLTVLGKDRTKACVLTRWLEEFRSTQAHRGRSRLWGRVWGGTMLPPPPVPTGLMTRSGSVTTPGECAAWRALLPGASRCPGAPGFLPTPQASLLLESSPSSSQDPKGDQGRLSPFCAYN